MGLGQYVYPRFALHLATGQAAPIERLCAHCLWYPSEGMEGLMVSGHVIYAALALHEVMLGSPLGEPEEPVPVERGEEGVSHQLTAPVHARDYAAVPRLIDRVLEQTRRALPATKRKLLQGLPAEAAPEEKLARLELLLQEQRIHVLVPLSVGRHYQLFSEATEVLLAVSPLTLKRAPRLCFVLLSTDTLEDERRRSPWLRQATELMALPVNAVRAPVVNFLNDVKQLRPALKDEQLLADLATVMQDVTGGWPDLSDRFYNRLLELGDVDALREHLRQLALLLRTAELNPAQAPGLLELGIGHGPDLPDLLPENQEALEDALQRPRRFTWEEHGRAYLAGVLSCERQLAVPRSRLMEALLRGRPRSPRRSGSLPIAAPREPGPHLVRWLHVSDFHFSPKSRPEHEVVLGALLTTVEELRQRGRQVDLIFVTGDIAHGGGEAEYALAEAYLARLCEAAGVSRAALHMVPGNHDINRESGKFLLRTLPSAEEALRYFQAEQQRPHLHKLEAFRAFYNRFYADANPNGAPPRQAAPGQATAGPELVQVRELQLGLLPLNSAWFAQDDHDSGSLLVGEALVRSGLAAIAAAPLRIAFMHHPFSDLIHFERKIIQEQLSSGCHLLLRGHLHDAEAQAVNSAYRQTIVLAAGASFQGHAYQNRAFYVEVDVEPQPGAGGRRTARVSPYPIRYEVTGHDRWTLDTSVFPRSYPSYLETLSLEL